MTNRPEKTEKCLGGVKCNVQDCYFNSHDCGCKASCIEVDNSMLGMSTNCKTYTTSAKHENCEGCD